MERGDQRKFLLSRWLAFWLCVPSGGALLAKVYGIASMPVVTFFVFLPCSLLLIFLWFRARRDGQSVLSAGLTVGFWGGFLGTLGYDLARIPFWLTGWRVFTPIAAYGVWIADAEHSSRLTDLIGWLYHFSNGITFGIMFSVLMLGRHWLWAILWALLLETIALISPFRELFGLSGNYSAIAVAYLGHLAYGYPLGIMTRRWSSCHRAISTAPKTFWAPVGILIAVAILLQVFYPGWVSRDSRVEVGVLRVEGRSLNPSWTRVSPGEPIRFKNPSEEAVHIRIVKENRTLEVPAGGEASVSFASEGIQQVYVLTERQTVSSFISVESSR